MTTNAEIFSRLGSSSTTATVMLINSGDIVGNASFQVGRASGNASLTWNEIGGYWTAGLVGSEPKLFHPVKSPDLLLLVYSAIIQSIPYFLTFVKFILSPTWVGV